LRDPVAAAQDAALEQPGPGAFMIGFGLNQTGFRFLQVRARRTRFAFAFSKSAVACTKRIAPESA